MPINFQSLSKPRFNCIFFYIIGCLYVGLRLYWLDTGNLWFDEVFTISVARLNWSAMLADLARDGVHPPLFYVLLKIWSSVSISLWWLKLFSILTSFLTILPFYLLCRQLGFELLAVNLAFLSFAVNGYFLEYAVDLRMYGQLQLFTLASIYLYVKKNKIRDELPNFADFTDCQSFARLYPLFRLAGHCI